MNLKQHVRVFHVTLATLTILAFISGDFGVVQDILGYGVAAIIALRLLWVLSNPCRLCLNRFLPRFHMAPVRPMAASFECPPDADFLDYDRAGRRQSDVFADRQSDCDR